MEAEGLEIDESLLTGESDAVVKAVGDEVLSGSIVVSGRGAFQATGVGANSFAHKIATEAKALHGDEVRAHHRHQPSPQVPLVVPCRHRTDPLLE